MATTRLATRVKNGKLSEQQCEVVYWISQGEIVEGIADRMELSPATVKQKIKKIRWRLDAPPGEYAMADLPELADRLAAC